MTTIKELRELENNPPFTKEKLLGMTTNYGDKIVFEIGSYCLSIPVLSGEDAIKSAESQLFSSAIFDYIQNAIPHNVLKQLCE